MTSQVEDSECSSHPYTGHTDEMKTWSKLTKLPAKTSLLAE